MSAGNWGLTRLSKVSRLRVMALGWMLFLFDQCSVSLVHIFVKDGRLGVHRGGASRLGRKVGTGWEDRAELGWC